MSDQKENTTNPDASEAAKNTAPTQANNELEATAEDSTSNTDTPEVAASVAETAPKEETAPKDKAATNSTKELKSAAAKKNKKVETKEPKVELTEAKEVAAMAEEPEATAKQQATTSQEDEEPVEGSDEDPTEDIDQEDEVDYASLEIPDLISAFKELMQQGKVAQIKNAVDAIRTEFNAKFQEEFEAQKEKFVAEGGNVIDFHYSTAHKKSFSELYFNFKEKLNHHYKNLKKDLQSNLNKRLELIEELKGLLAVDENINTTFKHFKDIQERWKEAGPIQRDKYNTVWNTYHHHVENFYDFLHLNREFRDLDFKHNLDQKLKLITRAEELGLEANINKAFRELQMLHKVWKEEVGPVAKQYRDEVWDKFSAATKVIHDKRLASQKDLEKSYEGNLLQKQEVIASINELTDKVKPSHQGWQNAIKTIQEMRNLFFEIGKVPRNKNQEIWDAFKAATRNFNKKKNEFYKAQKKEQYTNLEQKLELIKVAESHKDSDDFKMVTPIMKKIQGDWKKIGHVPRKDSDKIWKQFKSACNHYFDRLHAQRNESNQEEMVSYGQKKELLDKLKALAGDKKAATMDGVKALIASWKEVGRVPFNKRSIEGKFYKALDQVFATMDIDKSQAELIKFENKISGLISQKDNHKLQNERAYLSKKINDIVQEINQLENNLGFFQHVDDKNPMVQEVHKNINKHKASLEVWRAKMKKLKAMQ